MRNNGRPAKRELRDGGRVWKEMGNKQENSGTTTAAQSFASWVTSTDHPVGKQQQQLAKKKKKIKNNRTF